MISSTSIPDSTALGRKKAGSVRAEHIQEFLDGFKGRSHVQANRTFALLRAACRWAVASRFHPQLFVDAHEMGSLHTYLFYPQNSPHNPYLPARLDGWHNRFAADQAAAFDDHGWAYYSREWADGWGHGVEILNGVINQIRSDIGMAD